MSAWIYEVIKIIDFVIIITGGWVNTETAQVRRNFLKKKNLKLIRILLLCKSVIAMRLKI